MQIFHYDCGLFLLFILKSMYVVTTHLKHLNEVDHLRSQSIYADLTEIITYYHQIIPL